MNRSLLIVAEDPMQLEILSSRFFRAGYQVVGLTHPRQALEAASFRAFQVALIDYSLPETNGLDLMRKLQGQIDGLQTVMLSGCELRQRPRPTGLFAWLVKPCSMQLVEATVDDACDLASSGTIAQAAATAEEEYVELSYVNSAFVTG